MVVEIPKLKGCFFCSSFIARMVSLAFSNPRFTCRTWLCMSPTPSIDTRVLKMMFRSWHISTILVSIGMPRWGVRPVVFKPNLRSRGSLSSMTRQMSTRSLRVVGSPPETLAFSMFFHRPELKALLDLARASCPSCGRRASSCLHISQRASQTNVQWKIRTVGWIGVMSGDVAVDEVAGGADRRFGEILQRVDLCHKVLILNLLWPQSKAVRQ